MKSNRAIRVLFAAGLAGCCVATSTAQEIRDVDRLADGSVMFTAICDPNHPDPNQLCPLLGVVDWSGSVLRDVDAELSSPHSAQRLPDGSTLIADTGNNRVLIVDAADFILWQRGGFDSPTEATRLPNGNTMIVESTRVIEVNPADTIVWQFGVTGVPGAGPRLNSPQKAERLPNGNTLIADTGNHRVIEVNPARQIVRTFSNGLNSPGSAKRLPNGNTLIADTGNNRIVEFNAAGLVLKRIATGVAVYDAERLANGNTLAGGDGWIREYSPQGQLLRQISFGQTPDRFGGVNSN